LVFEIRRERREELRRLEDEKREALEQERQRIARDVHDDLGSGLSALSLQTAIAQYKTTSPSTRRASTGRSPTPVSGRRKAVGSRSRIP
jgi:signal transduction histidine kinase